MLPAMERLSTTRAGAIAVSGVKNSTATKIAKRTTKVTSRPMILGADHGNSGEPPHWRARMIEIIEGAKKKKPMGSSCLSWASKLNLSRLGGSMRKKMRIARMVKPPMGRLM